MIGELIKRIKKWFKKLSSDTDGISEEELVAAWTNNDDEAFEIMNQWTQNQLNDSDPVEDEDF